MKCKLHVLFLSFVLCSTGLSATQNKSAITSRGERATGRCRPNPDPLYVRSRVLDELADILNQSIPEYSQGINERFYSDSERGIGFFIIDLTNPSNKELTMKDCVDFINGHIYHVSPLEAHYALSHIVILEEGKLKVFRSINCPGRGDSLEDVIKYASAKLAHDRNRDRIINRIRNYKKYGLTYALQHTLFICNKQK